MKSKFLIPIALLASMMACKSADQGSDVLGSGSGVNNGQNQSPQFACELDLLMIDIYATRLELTQKAHAGASKTKYIERSLTQAPWRNKSEIPLKECFQKEPSLPLKTNGGRSVQIDIYHDAVQVYFMEHDGSQSKQHYEYTDSDKNNVLGEARAFDKENGFTDCDPVLNVSLLKTGESYTIIVQDDVFSRAYCATRNETQPREYVSGPPAIDPLTGARTYTGHMDGTNEVITLIDERYVRARMRTPWTIEESGKSFKAFTNHIKQYLID